MSPLVPHPVLIQWGSLAITAHGLFFALGGEFGYLILARLARQCHLSTDFLAERVALIFFAGLVSARIGFFLIYPSTYQSLGQVLAIWQGGLVSFFGIAGGLLAAWFIFKKDRLRWLDLLGVATLAAWAIGRLGNFWAGDSDGITSHYWIITYGRVPIQLFESLGCLGLYFFWSRHLESSKLLAKVLLSYLALRFLVDFWRNEGVWDGLHVSQWASLILAVTIGIYLRYAKK